MVIFADIQKLLLYQRLNLGFECDNCKRTFFNRLEHLQHTLVCSRRVPEQLECVKCGKTFGHQKILQLHLRIHNLSESSTQNATDPERTVTPECIDITESETSQETSPSLGVSDQKSDERNVPTSNFEHCLSSSEVLPRPCESQTSSSPAEPTTLPQPSHTIKAKRKIVSKNKIGLTKVRMEDCLRCDACSCIYIDPKDYYKHMRNFHHLNLDNSPIPPQRSRKKCRSCCKQCRGVNCGGVKRPRATQSASNLIFRVNMRDNIQDRWMRMVAQQMSSEPEPEVDIKPDVDAIIIKPDPEPSFDLSLLLSQVEVKIKTEPPDDYAS